MNDKQVIQSQYRAALSIMRQTIEKCPEPIWNDTTVKNRFWHVAYHALFYTHLYAQVSEETFQPWQHHRDEYQVMGQLPWPPHKEPTIGEPYTKDEVLTYLDFCWGQIPDWIDAVDLQGPSGFEWLPFNKLELQFYSIRHLMMHVGELAGRLGDQQGIDVDWVGMSHERS
ncbi:MAG: DinB family protein [Pseudomonadota bacterium]